MFPILENVLTEFTKTEKTKNEYQNRVSQLVKKARKELDIPSYETFDSKQFVGWLISYKNNYSASTWKQYKAAVSFFLQNQDGVEEELDLLSQTKQTSTVTEKRTSAKKQKKFPVKDFIAIVSYLNKTYYPINSLKKYITSEFNEMLKVWLHAGILTGLRPIEWAESKYVEESKTLIVKNAKNTNGRTHGDFRTLHLNNLTDEERNYIKQQVKNANSFFYEGRFEYFQRSCGNLLTRIGKEIFPKRETIPSLYSLRHQFAADAKSSGFSLAEIAALMGHAVDDTATVHYAKMKSGKNLCRVQANAEEVLKVKQVYNKNHDQKNQIKKTFDLKQ